MLDRIKRLGTGILAGTTITIALAAAVAQAQTTLYTFDGDAAGDQFGISVSGAGDVNGDGYPDLLVGAAGDDTNGIDAGYARVFSGFDGSVLHTIYGGTAGARFGDAVSGAGDVNNDGFADFIIGAPQDPMNGASSGSARVFSGLDGAELYAFFGVFGDFLGRSVSGVGDLNSDGHADFIIGVWKEGAANPGAARVFSGVDGSILFAYAGVASEHMGGAVSGAGDVDGDGTPDFIIAANRTDSTASRSGSATGYSGADGLAIYTFNGDAVDDLFGGLVGGAGDVNNDGRADVIVGTAFADTNGMSSGMARVFSGIDGSVLYTFNGDSADDRFGDGCCFGAGDVNGDGHSDLMIGAFFDDNNGANSGSVRVFSGFDGSILSTFNGDSAGDLLGPTSGAGDVNGDGCDDVIMGALLDDNNGTDSGSVRVISFQCEVEVSIDIKPGSFPNSMNLSSGGATPVAILGSASLDVNDIDPDTLTLGTAGIKTVGRTDRLLCSVEDVSGDFSLNLEGAPDGFADLVCHFLTFEIVPEMGDTQATLLGNFSAGAGGGAIKGTDAVNVVP